MSYKLAVLDVDGTLLTPDGTISPRVRDAVHAVRETGCLVTLASGRRLWAIRTIAAELGIATPVILYNGAFLYDLGREEALHIAPLSAGVVRVAVDIIWGAGLQPTVYENPLYGERVFTGPVERQNPAAVHYFTRRNMRLVRVSRDSLATVPEPLLLTAMGEETDMHAINSLIARSGVSCATLVERQSFVPGSSWWQCDVMAPGCSKAAALTELCRIAGVSLTETIAIGDGINDLELITTAGLGIAMGNAVEPVRTAAAAVVGDNSSHGVAEALERYVLQAASTADAVRRVSGA